MSKFRAIAAPLAALFLTAAIASAAEAGPADLPEGIRGDGKITLFRPVKNARETFRYRNPDGTYSHSELDAISYFFRCRLTDEEEAIDPSLIEILDSIEDHFSAKEIRLISAYRSPTRNGEMRSRNRRVARESYHMKGMAADIEVPGVSAKSVRDFAYFIYQGGIGYYRNRSFVHVDTGPRRTWGFKPKKPHSRSATAMSQK